MNKFKYNGSTPNSHGRLLSAAIIMGLQHIRCKSIGERLAELANEGNLQAVNYCESNPDLFSVTDHGYV